MGTAGRHDTGMVSVKSFDAEYIWPCADMDLLRSLFSRTVPGYFPPKRANGKTTIEGPIRRETSYSSLEDLLLQPLLSADRFWISIDGLGEDRHISLGWNSANAKLSVTAYSGSESAADADLEIIRKAIEEHLGLKLRTMNRVEVTLASASPDFPFLRPLLQMVDEILGPNARFEGTWKTGDAVYDDIRVIDDWMAAIKAEQNWTAEWQGRGHHIFASYEPKFGNVRFEISSWDSEVLSKVATRIKTLPGLKNTTDKTQKQGEARRYFLSGEATREWYEKALSLILPFIQEPSVAPWGRIRRGGKNKSNRGYGDFSAWKAALVTGMRDDVIEQSYLSYFGRERNLTFDLDHIRDLLYVDVQSVSPQEVEEVHLKLTTELNLRPAPENAYRDRQWGRTYDVRMPDRAAFAAQLKLAIENAFSGRRVLLNGTLHMGGSDEEVKPCSDLSEFLDGIEADRDLTEFHLVLTGPNGQFMGVHGEKKLSRIRLLASMRLDRFQAFAATLKTGLKRMELSQTYDTDPATGTVEEKKNTWMVPIATAVLGLLGGLVGTKLYEALREPSEIIIDRPLAKDGAAEIQAHDTTVSWTYKKPHLLGPPGIDGNHTATVNVTRLSDNRAILQEQRKTGSAALAGLDDGSYYIKVDSGESYKTLVLTVKTKPTPAPQPGAALSSPRNKHSGKSPGE
jgi:hypothetical protein